MKRGEKSPESVKRRKQLQRKKMRYMELREELQLAGVIPTEPAGAIRDEQVDPATQRGDAQPGLVAQAIRQGWAVPEDRKPGLVDEMVKIVDDPEESNKVKVAAFNALRQADQAQWERDHPQEGGKATGPMTLNINVETVDRRQDAPVDVTRLVEVVTVDGRDGQQDDTGVAKAANVPRQ